MLNDFLNSLKKREFMASERKLREERLQLGEFNISGTTFLVPRAIGVVLGTPGLDTARYYFPSSSNVR